MSAPSEPSAFSARTLIVMFVLVSLLALGLLSLSWHGSLLDRYEFRQLQTALNTWWIARDGWQLDYPLPLFGPPWSVPFEFPIYQVIVAALHHVTGLPIEQAGRLTGIVFLFACLPALHDLLGLARLPPSRRLVVLAVVLTSPIYLFYARAFMIETTALCFAVWFLALFRRSLESRHWGWLVASTLAATLAGLTKVTTFLVFGLPALALAVAAWRAAGASRARLLVASLVPAVVSLGLTWWWLRHGDAVKDSNPFTGFLTARELRAWNFGPWSLRLDWSFWIRMQENIVHHNLAEGAIAIALFCAAFAPARSRWMAAAGFLGFASGPLVFANLYHVHDYYYAANSLLLLAAAGLLLASVWDDPRLPRGANWLALVLVFAFQLHAYYRGYYTHHARGPAAPPQLADVIREAVPAEGVVLIYGAHWDPLLPYYCQRRALMVAGDREDETGVLEDVLARLPPRHIAAMVIHGDKLRARSDFIAERAARFSLSPQPVAREGLDDLYLPAGLDPKLLARLAARPPDSSVRILSLPAQDAFSAALKIDDLAGLNLAIFQPAPVEIRSKYGVSSAAPGGQPVLNAHAPSELVFRPAAGAAHFHATVGLPDAAFASGKEAVTDGITVDVFVGAPGGGKQLLFHRRLDPAKVPGDRGPQAIEVDLPQPFPGEVLLRLGNGPAANPTNDWAYCAGAEIR
ncbi:MAG TPA: hypothetical protein VG734_02490 [Lacunisphaera sp.]|nr:hypothetical protein [Lacunisphaera sp.]